MCSISSMYLCKRSRSAGHHGLPADDVLEEKWSGAGSGSGATRLFKAGERTRKEPLRRGEGLFEFYDSCASPGYDEFRAVVNGWLAQMPAGDRNELITRMRYGGDREFG